jgi:Tol biopolymer transport system component
MSEFTDLLERARQRFPPPEMPVEHVIDRRERQVRNQRLAAGALAVALVAAGVGAAVTVARMDDRVRPGGAGEVIRAPFDPDAPCFDGEPCWDQDVFLVRPDGSGLTRVGLDAARDIGWSWSPDGERIAFVHADQGQAEIYTMAADGSDARRLTDDPAYDLWPVYSPDGSKIAFTSDRAGTTDVFVMDADGSNVVRLTRFENDGLDDYHPTWSPDGARIAFVRGELPPGAAGKLWVVDADGSGAHVLLDQPLVSFPSWSPDGTRIAFDTGGWPDVSLGVLDLGTGSVTDLGVGYAAHWSPDSSRLAISVPDAGIQILEIAHPTRRVVVHETGHAALWSPDGEWIAFTDVGLTASSA